MTVSGIDIASYQPADYDTTGLAFVAVKATEGTGYVNPKHTDQVAHARAHALVVMHYHFVRPGSMSAQLTYFLQHAAPAAGDVLALDWEDTGVTCADKDAWLHAAQQAAPAHRVVLYCNRDFWFHHDTTSVCGDGLWIADPDAPAGHPQIQHPWLMHQYSETGGMDHDVANFPDARALAAWAAGTTTPSTTQEDDVSAMDVLTYRNPKADAASMAATGQHIPDVYGYIVGTNHAVAALRVELAELRAEIAAIAKGAPLTAEELQQVHDAAEAGGRAALADSVVHVEITGAPTTGPTTPTTGA